MHTGRTVAPGSKCKKHFNSSKKQQQQKIGKETFQPSIANMEIASVELTDLTERSFRSGNFMDLKSLRKRSSQTEQLLLKVQKPCSSVASDPFVVDLYAIPTKENTHKSLS